MLDYRTHTFLEVYRQRSFTRAAENLLITQPPHLSTFAR